jgi:hypothetical protein
MACLFVILRVVGNQEQAQSISPLIASTMLPIHEGDGKPHLHLRK